MADSRGGPQVVVDSRTGVTEGDEWTAAAVQRETQFTVTCRSEMDIRLPDARETAANIRAPHPIAFRTVRG